MKTAILTLPLHINYGGILQAYALQTALQRMGHEVSLYDTPFPGEHKLRNAPSRWNHLFPFATPKKQKAPGFSIPKREIHRRRHITRFLYGHFSLRPMDYIQDDVEAIVVGSDQIWRPLYFPSIELAFLSFAEGWKNVRRVAYACSFGTDRPEYSARQIERCGRLVERFDGVSVREASMIPLIRDTFRWDCRPQHLVDPTLLLEAQAYRELCRKHPCVKPQPGEKKLFCYFLDPNDEKQTLRQAAEKTLRLRAVTPIDFLPQDADWERDDYAPIESWLSGFDEADAVLTDSFHGCVFSIIFNKPFAVVCNQERGAARFHSLLRQFGLENQLLTDGAGDKASALLSRPIDWGLVNRILEQERGKAFAFLQQYLPTNAD